MLAGETSRWQEGATEMGLVFQTKPGQVVQLEEPAMSCDVGLYAINSSGAGINYTSQKSIVTRLTISQRANVQFLHGLGSLIYVYVFGDRMGTISLSGLAFLCACPGQGQGSAGHGANNMITWYRDHRVSRRKSPLRFTIGSAVIEGFVTGFTEDIVDPSTNLVQWGVELASLPEDN
jgi:hypothetical protein